MEMILWRCPLVTAVFKDWHEPFVRVGLTELLVGSSSSSLLTESNIIAHTTAEMETTEYFQHKLWLVLNLMQY